MPQTDTRKQCPPTRLAKTAGGIVTLVVVTSVMVLLVSALLLAAQLAATVAIGVVLSASQVEIRAALLSGSLALIARLGVPEILGGRGFKEAWHTPP
jgi:hypothetical protein